MSKRFSLKGLQAFEATIRTGSFVAAAEELGVTPAAISQLVRGLEGRVKRQLFYRVNRKLVATEASLLLAPRLTALFSELDDISAELADENARSHLVISVPPSVTGWLSKRMPLFVAQWGPLDFTLRGEEDPVDFERQLVDIRWSFGAQNYAKESVTPLYQDHAFAVCSPDFLYQHGPFDDETQLLNAPLIHTDWGPASAKYPSWQRWFDDAGIGSQYQNNRGMVANSSITSVELAVNGLGVALCQGFYLPELLAQGSLILAHPQSIRLAQPYCLTVPARSEARPVVAQFKDWLIAESHGCNIIASTEV